jgi:hypothetical protein
MKRVVMVLGLLVLGATAAAAATESALPEPPAFLSAPASPACAPSAIAAAAAPLADQPSLSPQTWLATDGELEELFPQLCPSCVQYCRTFCEGCCAILGPCTCGCC